MPTPRVISILDPARLLERAVEGLFPLTPATDAQPWPTLSAWVVLRQGGLRDDINRLAAARQVAGWFDSPICLFNELGDRWGSDTLLTPLGEAERHAIVSGLIDREGSAIFRRSSGPEAWVPAIDRLIGELASEGISAEEYEHAALAAATDDFSRDRAVALGHIYSGWIATLAAAGRGDGRDTKVRLARDIAADPTRFAERLGGRRDIRFVGLADLRGGWRHLLGALAASPALDRLEILTTFKLELPAVLGALHEAPAQAQSFASALHTEAAFSTPAVSLIEAPDAAREVEIIALRVRALIDSGVPAPRIAVIARQARPLVNDIADALTTLGVPVTARRRTALSHTASARALRTLLAAAGEHWSRHSVVEIAENPLLATRLDANVVNLVGYSRQMERREDWRESLVALAARCVAREHGEDDGDEHRKALPSSGAVQATLAAWDALASRLAALETSRALAEWFAWTAETLNNGAWGLSTALEEPLADRDTWNADVRARDLIVEYAAAWHAALSTFGGDATPIDAATFAGRLQLLLEQDLVTPPVTEFGVVVAEALAAGWRAFDHVFVIGLSAGVFPQRPVGGGLLDREDRLALVAAGLDIDAPDAWRARESELFRVVCAAPRVQLTLSWPVMDASGRDVARSAFVDEAAATLGRVRGIEDNDEGLEEAGLLDRIPTWEALVSGFPVAADAAAVDHAQTSAARERARALSSDAWNGGIEDASLAQWIAEQYDERYTWSATQLEQVAKCRWHWFAQRLLKLEPRADADDLMEPTVRGSLLHDALDRFFTAAFARVKQPVFLRGTDAKWATPLMEQSLTDAWKAAEAAGEWLGPDTLRNVALGEMRADLCAYLAFDIEWNEKSYTGNTSASKQVRTGFVEGEYEFKDVRLRGSGVTFMLRGSIDRVDRGVDERVPNADRYIAAIDYKSTKYATPAAGKKIGWDDGVVLQVPLYAAALQQLRPQDLVARMEYRTLRSPETVHALSLAPVAKGALQAAPEAEQKLADALDAAGRRVQQVRDGVFPADPAPSCGCSPYCPARDICRIPGGPVELW
ncbi:MAG: PD-(D/E)XK nuclease family protein [Gemmatimonadetes bacterium]|nr:PD-(D/E)XK nuclease family protein [Gemmatimonadota bacterium]